MRPQGEKYETLLNVKSCFIVTLCLSSLQLAIGERDRRSPGEGILSVVVFVTPFTFVTLKTATTTTTTTTKCVSDMKRFFCKVYFYVTPTGEILPLSLKLLPITKREFIKIT